MTLSEYEGDAVFFYLRDYTVSYQDLARQTEEIYLRFHEQIQRHKILRICHCGACNQAVNLKIKFVAHQGDFEMMSIRNQSKPYGKDVIVLHRLLKNTIPLAEYLLMTSSLSSQYELHEKWVVHTETIDKLGRFDLHYRDLDFLQADLPEVSLSPPQTDYKEFASHSWQFLMTKEQLITKLADFSIRSLWLDQIDEFVPTDDGPNRIGSRHQCIIGDREIDFETSQRSSSPESLGFAERTLRGFPLGELMNYYVASDRDDGVELTITQYFKPRNLVMSIMFILAKAKLIKSVRQSIANFRERIGQ